MKDFAHTPYLKKLMLHDTELAVRAINRRLEGYGKIMYTPEFAFRETHLQQYQDLVKSVYAVATRYGSKLPTNFVGMKGNYILLSRSKENLEYLLPHLDELKRIIKSTPTFGEALKSMDIEAGRKLNRKERLEMLKRVSTMRKIQSLEEFFEDSEFVGVADSTLYELLKPFRGASKGGTRQKGRRVSQDDWDALVNYIKSVYLGIRDDSIAHVTSDKLNRMFEPEHSEYTVDGKFVFPSPTPDNIFGLGDDENDD